MDGKLLLESPVYLIGRWTGIIVFLLLIIDFTMMEIFRLRKDTMKEWLASRIYANKLHGITSATILLVAILHSMLLAFGHWNSLVSSFPLWMPLGENLAIMYNLGTLAACMMLFLALHGYFRNWFWKKWSHKAWVRTHFWTTICLIIIIFIHAITIGEELQFLGLSIRS